MCACFILLPKSYADSQTLPIVRAVKGDPYDFSEGGLGIEILKS
jgi:hypothetical protein